MQITEEHSLTIDEARGRINSLLDNLQRKYSHKISNPHVKWTQDKIMTFSADILHSTITGKVKLQKGKVILDGSLPMQFSLFKGTIEKMIKDELKRTLKK